MGHSMPAAWEEGWEREGERSMDWGGSIGEPCRDFKSGMKKYALVVESKR